MFPDSPDSEGGLLIFIQSLISGIQDVIAKILYKAGLLQEPLEALIPPIIRDHMLGEEPLALMDIVPVNPVTVGRFLMVW
jgi:hypothetical protein